ncbi:MAG: M50 family metallopeptidase [Syntrophales bacterium]
MFGNRITLFNLLGFKVRIDASWVILAFLIIWSLAQGIFPFYFEGLSRAVYWWMGAAGALGLFISIVFHELCHSLVARRYGIPMEGITLFIFGGVAEMNDEPQSPSSEFLMAFAGPLSSLVLAAVFYSVYYAGITVFSLFEPAKGVLLYLAWVNVILAGFNLIPAFPLDGGRVLRSVLWRWKKNLRWATRISSDIGSAFGVILILLGVFAFVTGDLIGGIWWFLIGMFLRSAAGSSYRQLLARKALEGEKIGRFMVTDPVTVPRTVSINQFVDEYVSGFHHKMFPVMNSETPVGCITTNTVKRIPREDWNRLTVGEISTPLSAENTVNPETDVLEALSIMNRSGNSRLMVLEGDRLVGVLSLKDMLKFLSIKLELGKT